MLISSLPFINKKSAGNKITKPQNIKVIDNIGNNKDYVYISALNNDSDPLLNKIKEVLDIDDLAIVPSLNNQRQLGLLRKMVTDLSRAVKDLNDNQPIDLISVSLLAAYNSAIDLLGEGNKNDLSDEIFSRFCVGK